MGRYQKTKFTGVFFEPSATKKHQGRPDQAWYIVYQQSGKRKWEKIGWASEGYTAAMASQIRAERVRDTRGHTELLQTKDITFGEAWALAWQRHIQHLASAKDDAYRYKAHLSEPLGNLHIAKITPEDVEAIKGGLVKAGKAPATIKHIVGLIGKIYNYLMRWGIYSGPNPIRTVHIPKVDNRRMRFLTKEEAATLLTSLKKRSLYTWRISMMSLYTGMRASEIIRLKGEHVDLDKGQVQVRDTKKSSNNRVVYLPSPIKELLSHIDISPGKNVFPMPAGGSYIKVNSTFARTVKDIGLNEGMTDSRDKVVFHSLRHTFASWMVMQGKSLYLVGTLLGHSTAEMTKRYAHLAPETQREAVEAIEGYFNFSGLESESD